MIWSVLSIAFITAQDMYIPGIFIRSGKVSTTRGTTHVNN